MQNNEEVFEIAKYNIDYDIRQDELLENSLSLITNSYISCNDIINAVSENMSNVIDGMNDAKKLQIEADTIMMSVWKEYFMSIILAFSIIPILRFSNAEWFNILIHMFVGRLLIVLNQKISDFMYYLSKDLL